MLQNTLMVVIVIPQNFNKSYAQSLKYTQMNMTNISYFDATYTFQNKLLWSVDLEKLLQT